MNLRKPFYQNPPLDYLPFSLSSSVLVLISSTKQEQVQYVAQVELRQAEAAAVTDVVSPEMMSSSGLRRAARGRGCCTSWRLPECSISPRNGLEVN